MGPTKGDRVHQTARHLHPVSTRCALLAACALCLSTPIAAAQTLNLGTPQAPTLGEAASALALARQLSTDADAIPDLAGTTSPRAQARRLAAALLETGQREAESNNRPAAARGSARILLARTIAAHLDTLDTLLDHESIDEPTRIIIAADLARLTQHASDDPPTIERALRETLAPLTNLADRAQPPPALGGWITTDQPVDPPAYRTLISALSAPGTPLSSATVDALVAADALAERADRHHAFRRSAESIRLALFGAAQGKAATDELPRWIGPAARATLEPALDRALATLADPGRRPQGLAELRRIARIMRLVRRSSALPEDQAGRRARESLSNYIAAPPSNRELEAQLLSGYERALELALATASLPDDRLLARPLRPAWREFLDTVRTAAGRIADSLPTLLNDSAAMTDPGTLALFNAVNQALDEARGLHALTALLTGQDEPTPGVEPVPLDSRRDLATRLLTMSQVASRAGGSTSGEGAAAKRDLGTLATDIAAWRSLPAERQLRAAVATPDPAWTATTDGREHDLLDLIDRTREAYLANVISQGTLVERAALRARMQLLADLLPLVHEVAVSTRTLDDDSDAPDPNQAPIPPALADWPGWELSRQAHRLLAEGLTDAISETVSLALRGEDERARLRIAAMRRDMAGALLPARLAIAWERVRPPSAAPLDEIGLGPPDDDRAWMPVRRELLAEFCRLAEELPGIRLRRDDAQDRTLRAYLTTLAQDALAELR